MPQAIVDPEELRRFARDLKAFDDALMDQTARIRARFNSLGETWRDQEHRRFAQDFHETAQAIVRFNSKCLEYINFLNRKAIHVEQYIRQR